MRHPWRLIVWLPAVLVAVSANAQKLPSGPRPPAPAPAPQPSPPAQPPAPPPVASFPAPRSACDDYADSAVRQYQTILPYSRKNGKCRMPVNSRWNPDRKVHYDVCIGWPQADRRRNATAEFEARGATISRCQVSFVAPGF